MLSNPQARSRAGQIDPYPGQQTQIRVSDYNVFSSKQAIESKTSSSGMISGLGATRPWGESIFNSNFGSKMLDSAQTKAQFLRPDSETFEPRSGSASLVQSSEADPWARRSSAWKLDLTTANAQPVSSAVPPSPCSFGPVSSQQWDKSFASATKQSLVVGTKPQHQPKYAQINSYTATNGTEKDSNSFSNFNGFFDEPVPQGYESTDFPWASTRSTNSPTDDMQKDAFGFSSAGASRKGSLPASRHGFESTMLPQNTDAFARRASRQDISSVAANLRSFQLRPEAQEENFVTRPGLNTQNSSSFRRPSVQLTSNLWLSDASILQDLPNDYSSHGTYGASSSVNRSPTDEYNSLRQNGQLHGSNYAASAYDVQHNGHSNGVSHAVQGADMSFSQSRDQWQVPSSPYPTMVGNRNGLAFPAEHLQQQAMYMNGQYQYLANQARTGQYPAQMGFGYYAMPTAHPMANMLPQMAASTPTPAYTGTHKLTNTHSKGIQSSKLHEFHANNNRGKRYELKDVFGHVVEFSGDQQGSRFLQTKLESANSDEKATLFAEIMPNARQLMQDIYGNYVVQKLFEHGDQTQKKILANTLKGHIPALSMQPYGCRVVQKAFDHILTDQQAELVAELNTDNRVTKCLRDQHGNHVIQKAIEVIPSPYIQFIYDALYGQIVSYSVHTFGCRVVQRMLEKQDEVLKESVLQELSKCTPDLIMDSFGNYVAQHVIKHGDDANRNRMIGLVLNNVKAFARHKFASNVVEKCIYHGTLDQQLAILNHVMDPQEDEHGQKDGLIEYVKCAYGNYVIQSLLENLPYHHGRRLCDALMPEVHKAKRTTPKKTIEGIEEKMARYTTPNSSRPSSMHSNGAVSTPTSITSSVTSVGPCLSDIMEKTQSNYLPMSASPVEQNFQNTSAVHHVISI